MKTIVIIHNLNSRGKNINEDYVRELLNKKGIKFHYFQTKQISDIDEIIKKYNNPSEFQYCSIGGDGSLNALVNSLMKNNITMPEVSCLPGGSGSDFIRTFALPQNIEQAVEHLDYDNFYEVDVGLIKNKTDAKTDTKTDTKTDKGTSFGDAIKANTPEPKSTVIQNTIKNTDNKGGDKKTTTPSGGGGDKKTTPSGGGEKKMSQIEKDNRQRFGNKRIDFLKQKQKDFRARQKGEMSKDDFNKKYPKSQSAKDAYARKNPNSSQAMQNMSYEPEGTPIQETSGYDPIKNYHLANDLAKVYQKIYEPVEEKVDSTDAENYNALVEFIIKEEIVSTVEEADAIIAELDNELVESYLTEGVITEGLMDAVNRVKQGVGNVAKKVGTAASGAMNKAKEVAGNVRDKVKTAVQTKVQQGRDLKSGGVDKLKQGNQLRQKTQAQTADVAKKTEMSRRGDTSAQSGMGNDPGAARAKLQFLKNKRAKMNQNNSGGKPNQNTSGGNNLGKKQRPVSSPMDMRNEAVEKDAYTTVLEYLLTQNHAATIEEANYIMTELDAETIQGIISES